MLVSYIPHQRQAEKAHGFPRERRRSSESACPGGATRGQSRGSGNCRGESRGMEPVLGRRPVGQGIVRLASLKFI